MNPIAAGVAGALISGVAMYTLGAKTTQVDAFTQEPAAVHAVDSQVVPATSTTDSVSTEYYALLLGEERAAHDGSVAGEGVADHGVAAGVSRAGPGARGCE